ncbi:hypothetical protein AB2063_001118 [Clostridium botulinum]
MKNNKYFEVKNKYLAEGLAFLGFKYFKFNNKETNKIIYSFEDTEIIQDAIKHLLKLKKEINLN